MFCVYFDSIKKKRHSFSVLHVDTFEFLAFPYIKTWECVCRSKYHFIKLKYWKYPNKTFARNSGQLSCLHIQMICSYTIWAIVSYTTFFFAGAVVCFYSISFVQTNQEIGGLYLNIYQRYAPTSHWTVNEKVSM